MVRQIDMDIWKTFSLRKTIIENTGLQQKNGRDILLINYTILDIKYFVNFFFAVFEQLTKSQILNTRKFKWNK